MVEQASRFWAFELSDTPPAMDARGSNSVCTELIQSFGLAAKFDVETNLMFFGLFVVPTTKVMATPGEHIMVSLFLHDHLRLHLEEDVEFCLNF